MNFSNHAFSAGIYSINTFPRTLSFLNTSLSGKRSCIQAFLEDTQVSPFLSVIAQQICSWPILFSSTAIIFNSSIIKLLSGYFYYNRKNLTALCQVFVPYSKIEESSFFEIVNSGAPIYPGATSYLSNTITRSPEDVR